MLVLVAIMTGAERGASAGPSDGLPEPVAFWRFQEATGAARVSEGRFNYSLVDGDPAHPVGRTGALADGLFGPYALNLTAASKSHRL